MNKDRSYIIESELQQLMDQLTFDGYGKMRDMFVFCCFPGMAHAGIKELAGDMLQI